MTDFSRKVRHVVKGVNDYFDENSHGFNTSMLI